MEPIGVFSGLASGIQWRELIDQIMQGERIRQVVPLTRRVTSQQSQVVAWNSYQSLTTRLGDAANKLQDGTAFSTFQLSSGTSPTTNRSLLSASAGSGASPGSYSVEVLGLARAEKLAGAAVASTTDPLGHAGEFTINGRTIVIEETDTLNAIRGRINAANTGATPSGVTATVLSTSSGEHRLILTSDRPGAAGIDLQDTAGDVLRGLGVLDETARKNIVVAGTDARIRIDGFEMTRQTNTISDAIAGVTLNLLQAEEGTGIDVTIARDQDVMLEAVRTFVNAYNDIRDFVGLQNTAGNPRPPLAGNGSLKTSASVLTGVLLTDATAADGAEPPAFSRLALVGVSLDKNGKLQIDESRLKSVLSTDLQDARVLFADVGGRMAAQTGGVTRTGDGLVAGQVRSLDRSITSLNRRVDDVEYRLERRRESLVGQFARTEEALGRVQSQGNWLSSQISALPRYNNNRG